MAKDRFKVTHRDPWLVWIIIGTLTVLVAGLLATYLLRPGRSLAEDAQTAAAIGDMDEAQDQADERRDEQRSAAALL